MASRSWAAVRQMRIVRVLPSGFLLMAHHPFVIAVVDRRFDPFQRIEGLHLLLWGQVGGGLLTLQHRQQRRLLGQQFDALV